MAEKDEISFSTTHPGDLSGVPFNAYVWCDLPPHKAKRCPHLSVGKCTHSDAPQVSNVMMDPQSSGLDHMRNCGMNVTLFP